MENLDRQERGDRHVPDEGSIAGQDASHNENDVPIPAVYGKPPDKPAQDILEEPTKCIQCGQAFGSYDSYVPSQDVRLRWARMKLTSDNVRKPSGVECYPCEAPFFALKIETKGSMT